MKRIFLLFVIVAALFFGIDVKADLKEDERPVLSVDDYMLESSDALPVAALAECAAGAILIEADSGQVLFESNSDEKLPIASVTKVMTLLLVMEALDAKKISLEDKVRASANACSMGGSQIFLKENEEMSVEDLIKSVVIASANDAAVVSQFIGAINPYKICVEFYTER